jgi:hypothetical protein
MLAAPAQHCFLGWSHHAAMSGAWETRSADEEEVNEREWRVENVWKQEARINFWRSVPCLVHMCKRSLYRMNHPLEHHPQSLHQASLEQL